MKPLTLVLWSGLSRCCGLVFTQVKKNIWLDCFAPGSFMTVWRLPVAPSHAFGRSRWAALALKSPVGEWSCNYTIQYNTLGASHLWVLMSPWRMDVKRYMKCWTAMKSWLFQASIRNCLNCVHYCDDHSSLYRNCYWRRVFKTMEQFTYPLVLIQPLLWILFQKSNVSEMCKTQHEKRRGEKKP